MTEAIAMQPLLMHRLPVLAAASALAACITTQGRAYEPDASDDGGPTADDGGSEIAVGEGGDDGPAASIDIKVLGKNNLFWFTDDAGKPTGTNPNTLYVAHSAHVHFILSSDPAEEEHKFMIMIAPMSPDINMPPPPQPPATYDWVAPATPNTYTGGINCSAHKNMASDVVVQ